MKGQLDPPAVILRFSSSLLKVSPIPQLTEAPRKMTAGLSVVAQDDHAGRIRIRAFKANLLDPHTVVVEGVKASPTGEPLLKLLLQSSLEDLRIRGRLGHLGARPCFTAHSRMVRAPTVSPCDGTISASSNERLSGSRPNEPPLSSTVLMMEVIRVPDRIWG
jgi:hypothetical protein